jgi:CcmD family protein
VSALPAGDVATLALAYGILGAALAGYLLHLDRRVAALRTELRDLRQAGDPEETTK